VTRCAAAAILALSLASASQAHAAPGDSSIFALVIGVNRSAEADVPQLAYADDDAARYLALFRAIGGKAVLLSELDENTRRVHPQAAAEARPPTRAGLERAVDELAADVTAARRQGVASVLYVVYAGHGELRAGHGAVRLIDGWLSGGDLAAAVIRRIGADQTHLIVDACHSYYLAHARGPGGTRRALSGFSRARELPELGQVGLLLSTSAARESHEWEGFQAGVFSHEVRSGLAGAADSDGDGQVSYREIAAFVDRANAAIPNERFRPAVYARPPPATDQLLDLRGRRHGGIEIDGRHAAHYILEDARGVRWLELHNGRGQTVRLVRPPSRGPLYLRRLSDGAEFAIPPSLDVVRVAALTAAPAGVRSRGAAHHAFELVFSLPFDAGVVRSFRTPTTVAPPDALASGDQPSIHWRSLTGKLSVAAGAVAIGAGAYFSISAARLGDVPDGASQREVAHLRDRIHGRQDDAAILYVAGGAAVAAGLLLWLWPDRTGAPTIAATADGIHAGYRVSF